MLNDNYTSLLIICCVMGMGGAFISLLLSRFMAKMFQGVQVVDPNTTDRDEQWLVQTIYHLARSAGLSTMPEVGIYPSPEINAFATGPSESQALVAVSSGLLHTMRPEEIEGVLGHEITHIANGDMVTHDLDSRRGQHHCHVSGVGAGAGAFAKFAQRRPPRRRQLVHAIHDAAAFPERVHGAGVFGRGEILPLA